MATFSECPNCNIDESGHVIWNCRDCGFVHCAECDDDNGNCPNCHGDSMQKAGVVNSEIGHSDDDGNFSECPPL